MQPYRRIVLAILQNTVRRTGFKIHVSVGWDMGESLAMTLNFPKHLMITML